MLIPSCDSKVRSRKNQKSTLGLPPGPGASCPHATIGEGGCWCPPAKGKKTHTCYVDKLQRAYPGVRRVLEHNQYEIQHALNSPGGISDAAILLSEEFARFKAVEKRSRSEESLFYRLHWSGDIYRPDYGVALGLAMANHPDITFWLYTRSWVNLPKSMCELKNVRMFISLDKCNVKAGLEWLEDQYLTKGGRSIRVSYMGNEIPAELKDFSDKYKIKFFRCPVDAGEMETEGACVNKCKFCINKQDRILIFEV